MDTAQNDADRLVDHSNRQGPWLAPGQRSLAGPGIREFSLKHQLVNKAVLTIEQFDGEAKEDIHDYDIRVCPCWLIKRI